MAKYSIVVDVGTQSLRGILFNKSGEIIYTAQNPYSPIFKGNKVEQDPRTWKDTLVRTLKELGEYISDNSLDIDYMSVTSQRASIIPVTKQNKFLHNAITWQDRRAYPQCETVKETLSMHDIYQKTGLRLDSYFSAPKIMWLKENKRDIYYAADKIIGVQDYITKILTDRFVTDHSQAARTLLMNIHTFEWDDELINAFGLDRSILPDLVAPGSEVGTLSAFIQEKTGLDESIRVFLAGGDQQAAALGLNVLEEGTMEANIGTGSFMIAHANKPVFDENMRVLCSASAMKGHWIVEAGLLTSGNIYEWYNREFFKGSKNETYRFQTINKEVDESKPGANGLVLIPHFKGSAAPYWNPLSKGVFFNATLEHTRGDFARAILEGITYEMSENIELIEALVGYVDNIHAAGGLTNYSTFNQIQADVFNKAVSVYDSSEATAIGALMSAMVSNNEHETFEDAFKALRGQSKTSTYHSTGKNIPVYVKLKRTKKHLYSALNDAHIYSYMNM